METYSPWLMSKWITGEHLKRTVTVGDDLAARPTPADLKRGAGRGSGTRRLQVEKFSDTQFL